MILSFKKCSFCDKLDMSKPKNKEEHDRILGFGIENGKQLVDEYICVECLKNPSNEVFEWKSDK